MLFRYHNHTSTMNKFLLRLLIVFISYLAISTVVDLGIRKMVPNADLIRNWIVVGLFFSVTNAWFLGKPLKSIINRVNNNNAGGSK